MNISILRTYSDYMEIILQMKILFPLSRFMFEPEENVEIIWERNF